jgi:L-ornithine N5-oxygenase
VNEIFDANFVDFVHSTAPELHGGLLAQHYDTNYSVVDSDLIRRLYNIHYAQKVSGVPRLRLHNLSTVSRVEEVDDCVRIHYASAAVPGEQSLEVDAVIFATGYTYPNPPKVLSQLRDFIRMDSASGKAVVDRHYRMQTDARLSAGIYVQGCNESTHGLSDTLLSILPIRSEEILHNLLTRRVLEASKTPHHNVHTSALGCVK